MSSVVFVFLHGCVLFAFDSVAFQLPLESRGFVSVNSPHQEKKYLLLFVLKLATICLYSSMFLTTALEIGMTDPDTHLAQGWFYYPLPSPVHSVHQGEASWYLTILWTSFHFSTPFYEMVKREESSTASSNLDVSEAEVYVLPNDGLSLCSVPSTGLLISVFLYSVVVCLHYAEGALQLAQRYGFSWSLQRLQRQPLLIEICLGAADKCFPCSFLSQNFLSHSFLYLKNNHLFIS